MNIRRIASLCLLCLLCLPGFCLATDYSYLTLATASGAISGDSTDPVALNSIRVIASDLNLYYPKDSSGGYAGQFVQGPLYIQKKVDKASPKLYQALVTGETMTTFELEHWTTASEPFLFMTIELSGAKIVEISSSKMKEAFADDISGVFPIETVGFSYTGATVTFTPQRGDGTADTPITYTWGGN